MVDYLLVEGSYWLARGLVLLGVGVLCRLLYLEWRRRR